MKSLATRAPSRRGQLALGLLVCSTVLGIAGTDLVLPAVPTLPDVLGGDLERAQLVLAAFVALAAFVLCAGGVFPAGNSARASARPLRDMLARDPGPPGICVA